MARAWECSVLIRRKFTRTGFQCNDVSNLAGSSLSQSVTIDCHVVSREGRTIIRRVWGRLEAGGNTKKIMQAKMPPLPLKIIAETEVKISCRRRFNLQGKMSRSYRKKGCNDRKFPSRPPGDGDSHIKQAGVLVVSLRGVNFRCLVSLRVSRAKLQYFKPWRSRLGLHAKNREKMIIFLVF